MITTAKILDLLSWRRRRMEHDLARELRDHMDRRVTDLMRSGLSAAEARRHATLEFGSIDDVQEEVRDTWVWPALDHLIADARYAARRLRSRPAYTLLASLTLALGVGGTAAVYVIARGLLFDPLPYAHESEVGVCWKKTDWTDEEFLHVRDDFAVNARNEIVCCSAADLPDHAPTRSARPANGEARGRSCRHAAQFQTDLTPCASTIPLSDHTTQRTQRVLLDSLAGLF